MDEGNAELHSCGAVSARRECACRCLLIESMRIAMFMISR